MNTEIKHADSIDGRIALEHQALLVDRVVARRKARTGRQAQEE